MKKNIVYALGLCAALISQSAMAWWNPDWSHRMNVGINTAASGVAIAGAADNVPVLLRLHTGNFSFVDAKADGSDIRIVAGDDKTPLKFHIEKFDALNELALVWVQMPKINPGVAADPVWIYYGNEKAGAAEEPKLTYDASQLLVNHFGDKEDLPRDFSAFANNSIASSALPNPAGLIGTALSFAGSARYEVAAPTVAYSDKGMTVSMWFKPEAGAQNAVLFSQVDGTNQLSVRLNGDRLMASVGGVSVTATVPVTAGAWNHVAMTAKNEVALFLNGVEVGKAPAQLPAMSGKIVVGQGFSGLIDEVQLSSTDRGAAWVQLTALGQGQDQKLISYAPAEGAEEGEGVSYAKILLGSVTTDGWVVIGILMVMMLISFTVMITKALFIGRIEKANAHFKENFNELLEELTTYKNSKTATKSLLSKPEYQHSSLYRIFHIGSQELVNRFDAYRKNGKDLSNISPQSMQAIRASIDASYIRESHRLNNQMVLLSIAIAGGPYLGLLGTVVGVMITFAAIAAAGDVNVNAIAPGIAAALVATVAGLAVAIPSLFGYNYLSSKIKNVTSDMQVFLDEFITKLAENYSL